MPLLEHLRSAVAPTSSQIPRFKPMQIVGGQVSWGLQLPGDTAHFPAGPVNGHGSFVPHVPIDGAYAWFAGASYETDAAPRRDAHTSDLENLERLATLLPDAARALGARFVVGDVRSWHASRCATPDRLPVVGPLHTEGMASLWISSAMGSRVLSYAVLCAEILAARLGGEPLPVEGSLARLLAATRPGLVSHHL
jgi:tRNA 5-methylaminomethyl-2-thiouridine biosynthesis bifunctional protein